MKRCTLALILYAALLVATPVAARDHDITVLGTIGQSVSRPPPPPEPALVPVPVEAVAPVEVPPAPPPVEPPVPSGHGGPPRFLGPPIHKP